MGTPKLKPEWPLVPIWSAPWIILLLIATAFAQNYRCEPSENHITLYASPPIPQISVYAWRKIDPVFQVKLLDAPMTSECFVMRETNFNDLAAAYSMKMSDGVCIMIRNTQGTVRQQACN